MKKFAKAFLGLLLIVMIGEGCVEHRYYREHHRHRPEYYRRHHRPEPRVDIDIHN